jgi:dienelactone hydrolase
VIIIGELDDWTPARDCRNAVARRSSEGSPVKLVVYPGAYHGFNFARDKPVTSFGHHIEYNEAATRAAWTETMAALRAAFGR